MIDWFKVGSFVVRLMSAKVCTCREAKEENMGSWRSQTFSLPKGYCGYFEAWNFSTSLNETNQATIWWRTMLLCTKFMCCSLPLNEICVLWSTPLCCSVPSLCVAMVLSFVETTIELGQNNMVGLYNFTETLKVNFNHCRTGYGVGHISSNRKKHWIKSWIQAWNLSWFYAKISMIKIDAKILTVKIDVAE